MRTAQIGPDLRLVARYLSGVLGSVPERLISTKTRIRILLHFLYLSSYALLRVTICVIITGGVKTQQYFESLSYMFRQENLA